jgi:hypothetical protein
VTIGGISSERGKTRVNGPGQNAAAILSARGGQIDTQRRANSMPATWTMTGFSGGLALTW